MEKKPFLPAIMIALIIATSCGNNKPETVVTIKGDEFFINGKPTYEDRYWNGAKIQGLLMNARMVQGIFDDLNDTTIYYWAYPDTKKWDADRNTAEFIQNMESNFCITISREALQLSRSQ